MIEEGRAQQADSPSGPVRWALAAPVIKNPYRALA